MNDMMLAVTRFESELHAAGVSPSVGIPTLFTYISALTDGSDASWRAFYVSVYERLRELAARDYPPAGKAAEPLLQLLEDDLGTTLISAEERARIRASLVEDTPREASLPS